MRTLTIALAILLLPLCAYARDNYELVTTTTTGRDKVAGTDNLSIFVRVNGSGPRFELNNENINDFKRGATDRFPGFFINTPPEGIKFIELEVEGKDAWLLERIAFEVFLKDKPLGCIRFIQPVWMSGAKEGIKTQKKINFPVDGRFAPAPLSESSYENTAVFVPEFPTASMPLPSPTPSATPPAVPKAPWRSWPKMGR